MESAPATTAHLNSRPVTGFARRRRRRASAVLRGQPQPPRYFHISHRTSAITTDAQGMAGLVARLLTTSAPQTPWPTLGIKKARRADRTTDITGSSRYGAAR